MENSWINLQMFADGAGGEGDGAGDAGSGAISQEAAAPVRAKVGMYADRLQQDYIRGQKPAQAVVAPQEAAKPATEARAAAVEKAAEPSKKPTFQELIEGEYKDEYSKHTQEIVKKRLGPAKDAEARLAQLAPALQVLAERYGLDFSDLSKADPAALVKAVEDDDALYEQYAMREGITTEQAKKQMRMEREVAQARAQRTAQENEQQMRERYERLQQQSEEFKKSMPGFDLRAELQNPAFGKAIVNGFDVKSAYYAAHANDIDAMYAARTNEQLRQTAEAAKQNAAKAIQSGQRRPTENGATGAPASTAPKIDISKLTAKDFRDMAAQAARGKVFTSDMFR